VQRRFSTRDLGLSLRMVLLALCAAGLYFGIVAAIVLLALVEPTWTPYIAVLAFVITITTVVRYGSAGGLLLGATGAEIVSDDKEPALHGMLDRLAALADLPKPRLALVDSPATNAFTVGVRRRRSTVVVTTGLLGVLTPAEIEAVLAHELAHIANRDAGLMTVAGVPRAFGETIMDQNGIVWITWFFLWWLGVPIWALGSLVTLTLSRYREFAADRGSALLTGNPAGLMSALVKLDGADSAIPAEDLRSLSPVEALCVVSNGRSRFGFFADHPPLEKRLARLAEMARVMGEPVGA
jgi:heat shock protein HtpX